MKTTLFLLLMCTGIMCFGQNQFEWIHPRPDNGMYKNSGKNLDIKLRLFNPPYDAKYDILLNGESIYKNTKSERVDLLGGYINARVPLRSGIQSVVVTMATADGVVHKSPFLMVNNEVAPSPRLFLLAVGATPPDIDYTEEDAEDIYDIFTKKRCTGTGLYSKVTAKKLIGNRAEAAHIIAGIQDMTRGEDIHSNDVFILYVSSHGKNIDGKFHIRGSNYNKKAPNKTSVAADEIYDILDKIPAKKLVFFDACESGGGTKSDDVSIQDYRNYIINARAGYNVITSSRRAQKSHYDSMWKNGAFTEALLEGLKGRANYNNDEVITTSEIFKYISDRVPEICQEVDIHSQNPDTVKYQLGDFPFFDGLCAEDLEPGGMRVKKKSGKPTEGFASYIFKNGDGYEGNWADEQMNGEGAYFYQKTGQRYVGAWKDGVRSGEGQLFNTEGNLLYDGDWANDMRNGKGVYFYDDGTRYVGEWKNNKKHGTGKLTIPSRGYYEGKFKNGMYHGNGSFYYNDGSSYKGKWKNGRKSK